ncbi:MFS general substrate transporter, partial [Glonium stellatum]
SQESLESQPQPPPVDENIVGWDGPGDPENPFTWPFRYKLFVSAVLNSLPLVVNVGSSILSDASRPLSKEYHVGTEVDILTISLFLLGFTFGPLIFGPLSEKFGRRWPILIGVTLFATFCLPVALAQNFQTIMICRFFSGLFGSSSMAITGGTLTDIWATPVSRGIALDVFVTTGFIGPVIGPIVGSFITQSYLGWRWTMWVTAIVAYSFAIIAFFTLPETYGPVLLTRKAGRLRYETKNWAIHSKREEHRQDVQSLVRVYLLRPWVLLATEPILVLITLYLSFLYGLLFLFFEAYPISFQEDRHWKPQIGSLAFLGILVGNLLGLAGVITHSLTIFARQIASTPGVLVPERRLPPMIVGAVLLPIGLFWFGWTSHPGTPWPAQVVAGIPVGAAMFVIFIQGFKYIVDVYLKVANSAISANT